MRRLPWALALVATVLAVGGSAASSAINWTGIVDLPFAIAFALLGVASAATGAVVASRLPRNGVGWLILALGVGVGVVLSVGAYAEIGVETDGEPLPGYRAAAWLGDVSGIPIFFGITGFLLLLFPTGRLPGPRWRAASWFFGLTVTAAWAAYGLAPGEVGSGVPNPIALDGRAGDLARDVADLTVLLALPGLGLCCAALVVRLRRSRGVERQQLKAFAYAAALVCVGFGTTVFARGPVADLAFLLGLVALTALPVVAGVAIMRHGLYGIDVVINRTLVYAPLTAVLVGTYLLSVLVMQSMLRPLAGESQLAVAASTLAVAALFRPLRSRLQAVVDRRFYRHRYDAARTLETFSSRLRDELDIDTVGADLRRVIADTMAPTHVSLWLRGTLVKRLAWPLFGLWIALAAVSSARQLSADEPAEVLHPHCSGRPGRCGSTVVPAPPRQPGRLDPAGSRAADHGVVVGEQLLRRT